MRVLVRITVPVEAGNRALNEGKIGEIIGEIAGKARPEAMYFGTEPVSGLRTAWMVCDLASSSDLPANFESAILKLNATVHTTVVMNLEELQNGLARAMK
jgi:hypothetical protein